MGRRQQCSSKQKASRVDQVASSVFIELGIALAVVIVGIYLAVKVSLICALLGAMISVFVAAWLVDQQPVEQISTSERSQEIQKEIKFQNERPDCVDASEQQRRQQIKAQRA